jgi:two-component system, OmpR family, response regulator
MPRRIAIVEDDPVIGANYADVLKKHGYEVIQHTNRPDALAAMRTRLPDLVLLDIGLGDEIDGGFALCRELRALSGTLPIIFLTARDSDFDTVSGLRMGADDYVTKNMSLPHLLTRGPLQLDVQRFCVRWGGREVELTLTEFWIVHALAKFPGHVKNRDQLMSEVHIVVDDSTITSHIKRVRRKFAAIDAAFDRIDTIYGMGYRWRAET